ncbi:hypothetical protein QTP86_003036 [Hemibagrus guttatus]|nr:hypothetical protein QTP86_003036 [Hemibagrus guttatus]
MGRGSPIPPMLQRKIVEQYQKGVSQRKIAKSLKLSSSTVHNIIQRFRESGTISVRKGQGQKTILDARDLWALRRHCITYRNATVMEITTWAQEYFQKTLLVNTIHRAIRRRRLKLYRSKKKPYLNMIQKRGHFLWAKAHLKWTVAKWKTVLWSDESKFEVLFGKLGRHVIRTKEDKDNPSCYQRSVQKPPSLMDTDEEEAYVRGVKLCILEVMEDDISPSEKPTCVNRGIIVEENLVMEDIPDFPTAFMVLFGLLYALNIEYPKGLKYTFGAVLNIFVGSGEKCTNKVQSLKNKLFKV